MSESNLDKRVNEELEVCVNSVEEAKVKVEKVLFEHFTEAFPQPYLYLPMMSCFSLGAQFISLNTDTLSEQQQGDMVYDLSTKIQELIKETFLENEKAGGEPIPFELIYYALSSVAYSNLHANLKSTISSNLGGQ